MTDGSISPRNVFLRLRFVMVTKFVMITSSLGIIISERKTANTMFFPANSRRENAKAAMMMTTSMAAVVTAVKRIVFRKYRPSGTAVNASA